MDQIKVYYKGRLYQYYLAHFPGDTYEQWEVIGANSSLLLSCDRPKVVRNHDHGQPWQWVVDGKHLADSAFQDRIIQVLERHVRQKHEAPFVPSRKAVR